MYVLRSYDLKINNIVYIYMYEVQFFKINYSEKSILY